MRSASSPSAPPRAPDSNRSSPAGGGSCSGCVERSSDPERRHSSPELVVSRVAERGWEGPHSGRVARPHWADADAEPSPDRLDALALALAPNIGPVGYAERVARFGSAAMAVRAGLSRDERSRLRGEATRALDDASRVGARLLLIEDDAYPVSLRHLTNPPPFLFTLGSLAVLERPCVAIVGTRRATAYGERATAAIAAGLATAGVCVVSGMARGIDAAAHRAALASAGTTIAVLGTGVDVAYPAGHRALHQSVAERGLVLSEFPCGTRPLPGSFPRRNRIIAALGRMTVVVEAGHKSGALLTVGHAQNLGREVGSVPGPIDSPQCSGSNALLQHGAHVILEANDVLALIGLSERGVRPLPVDPAVYGDERTIWDALGQGAATVDWIVEHTALEARRVLAVVTALELAGLLEASPTGEIRRARG